MTSQNRLQRSAPALCPPATPLGCCHGFLPTAIHEPAIAKCRRRLVISVCGGTPRARACEDRHLPGRLGLCACPLVVGSAASRVATGFPLDRHGRMGWLDQRKFPLMGPCLADWMVSVSIADPLVSLKLPGPGCCHPQ